MLLSIFIISKGFKYTMAEKEKKDFSSVRYKIFEGEDNIFDEKGSTFLAMRKIAWYSEGKEEPTVDKAKWDLRKWQANESGKDIPMKGFSFLTEEGPDDLTKMLVHNGYGKTRDILLELKERDDFRESVEHLGDDNTDGDEYFDARTALLGA